MFENFSVQNKIISKWSDNFTRLIGRERHRRHYQNVKSSCRASKETIYFLAQIFFAHWHYCHSFQFFLIKLKLLFLVLVVAASLRCSTAKLILAGCSRASSINNEQINAKESFVGFSRSISTDRYSGLPLKMFAILCPVFPTRLGSE